MKPSPKGAIRSDSACLLYTSPEAGTQRLRDVINKNVSEEEIMQTCRIAFEGGYSTVKLYFMLGLPTEKMCIRDRLFAVSRIAGWAAHRMEEILTGGRIIRPGYKAVTKEKKYIPLSER